MCSSPALVLPYSSLFFAVSPNLAPISPHSALDNDAMVRAEGARADHWMRECAQTQSAMQAAMQRRDADIRRLQQDAQHTNRLNIQLMAQAGALQSMLNMRGPAQT